MQKFLAIVLIAAWIFIINTGQAASFPDPVFDKDFSNHDLTMAKKAFNVFSERCQPLMGEYAEDITSISISLGPNRKEYGCYDYRCEEFDWDKQIYISLKINDRPNKIPGTLRAWGHTEHYYLGGPKNPGMTIAKFPELCGIKVIGGNSGAVYISEPRLSFIE